MYSSGIERLLVATGILLMLCKVDREVMCAAEIFFGAHVEVVMMLVMENGINADHRRDADGARGQSLIDIGIVRAHRFEVVPEDAS